jgi:hypothetical protein
MKILPQLPQANTLKVTVAHYDILVGIRESQEWCPGALAIKRALSEAGILFSKVLVDEERVAIYSTDDSLIVSQNTPPELQQLLYDHDSGYNAKPCRFQLFLEEGFAPKLKPIGRFMGKDAWFEYLNES